MRKDLRKATGAMTLCVALLLGALAFTHGQGKAQTLSSFRFVAWGDTKSAVTDLSNLSDQAVLLQPKFTIYAGDLEESGFTQTGMDRWKRAMNGELTGGTAPNGMFDITFPVRGNHDSSNTAGWQAYFEMSQTAARVGASNYTSMSGQPDLTFSFDYGNSHFIGVDVTGDASGIASNEITWVDTDLAAAEARGLQHAFLYFHGPIYCVDGHCSCTVQVCSLSSAVKNLITVLNKHRIFTAGFFGHEHTYAYTYIDASRVPAESGFAGVTHPFHQFVTGDAGAGPTSCKPNRCDFNMAATGFVTVDVDGADVTVTFYKMGQTAPVRTITVSNPGGPTPTASKTPTITRTVHPPTWTVTPRSPTPTRTPTATRTVHPPTWTVTPAGAFADVPAGHPYFDEIEWLYRSGYTAGCATNPLRYCPDATMNRAESSVFVERGIHNASYDPPAPTSQVFADLPLDSWAANWVSALWVDQYTTGCGANPLVYCPWQGHTRAEGCVFYLRMLNGATYEPPLPATQTFIDVPLDTWFAKWVQGAYDAGLIPACQTGPELRFCPNDPLTRALAAYMMAQAKGFTQP